MAFKGYTVALDGQVHFVNDIIDPPASQTIGLSEFAALTPEQRERLVDDPDRPIIRYSARRWWQLWKPRWAYTLGLSWRGAQRAAEAQRWAMGQ